jgi:hypothetical protein
MILEREKLKFSEKNVGWSQFVHHKSCMDWPVIEPGPLQWEVSNKLPVPWHGLCTV